MLATLDRGILGANRALMILALAAMSVVVFVNVMLRYLTAESVVWAEEVARYLMVWLTCLGIGPLIRMGGHVAIDNLQDALPTPLARAVRVLVAGIVLAFCVFLAWIGWRFAMRTMVQTTPVLEIPFGYVAAAVPVGGALAVWHLLAVLGGYVRDRRFEEEPELDPNAAGSL
ncbi:TRAP transporter small permease [Stella sp.]|uniref:TRAP transporter small permease n=1 Tax=Stella sp. TaxID=2912054 RepID=UPI0035B444CB